MGIGERVRLARRMSRAFGLARTVRAIANLAGPSALREVHLPGLRHPVRLRRHSTDVGVLEQVFIDRDYDLDIDPPAWILDGGAHIGLAAVWFANRFPDAPITAVEAEASNYALLCRNVEPYPQITPVHGAVWSTAGWVSILNPSAATWAFRVSRDDDGRVRAFSVGDLIAPHAGMGPGLVKLDIEGAELEVFSADTSWLHSVSTLLAEVHEDLAPGTIAKLAEVLAAHPHTQDLKGDNLVIQMLAR